MFWFETLRAGIRYGWMDGMGWDGWMDGKMCVWMMWHSKVRSQVRSQVRRSLVSGLCSLWSLVISDPILLEGMTVEDAQTV